MIQILEDTALPLALKGKNPFKSRAYSNAARSLEKIDCDVAVLVQNIGLGVTIARKGWLTKNACLNCMSQEEIQKYLRGIKF